jgi:hypothetical protein
VNLITRSEAKEQGLKKFFTGVPCPSGHVAERYVGNNQCFACRSARYESNREEAAEYARRYREENRERLAEFDKAKYRANVAQRKEYARQYEQKNRAAVTERHRQWRAANKDALAEARRKYFEANKDRILESRRKKRIENSQQIVAKVRRWREANPDKKRAAHAHRRARKKKAVPPWFGEFDQFVWIEAADLARRRRATTGLKWEADHMIPLMADLASGLHVAANCQVIPAKLNGAKHNKLVLTEPLEWLRYI